MQDLFRRFKLHGKLDPNVKQNPKDRGSLLRRPGFRGSEIINGDVRPSSAVCGEGQSSDSASQPNPVAINKRPATISHEDSSSSRSYSYREGPTPERSRPNTNPASPTNTIIGHSIRSSNVIIPPHEDIGVLDMISPSADSKVLSMGSNTANVDASVYVSNQGNAYHFSGSASVQFIYGSRINQQGGKHALDAAIRNLHRSRHAEYDMVDNTNRGSCTPQTRTTVLEGLVDWCNSDEISLYWMDGMAGTGKTTIAYTFCEMLVDENLLGASFFCSRSLPDCRDSNLIISTIAFQLARKYAPFAEALVEALLKDEDILHRKLDVQLQNLLVRPWNAKKSELPPHPVIVVDAVDECKEGHSAFLQAISDHAGKLPFKMMITSRPEPSIRSVLLAKSSQTLKTFILHEVEDSLVEADIARYIESQLKKCLPSVPHSDALRLSWQCGKFFIYAATVCRFIMEADGDHFERFQSLLSLTPSDARNKAIEPIDVLYIEILRQAFSSNKLCSEIDGTRLVLHTVVCAREPLTREAIGGLLGLNIDEVETRLKSLRSLIFVPQAIDIPLSTFHASLPDFMMDSSRSGEFYCEPRASNLETWRRCLVLMKRDLRQNICHLDGQPPNDTIDPYVIDMHISPGLRYACVYWSEHWQFSDHSKYQTVVSSIHDFLTTGLVMYWLECLSLIRKLPISIQRLEMLQDALNESPDLAKLIHELIRCIECFYDVIESCPMVAYSAILAWAPSKSLLRNHYLPLRKHAPHVLCGLSTTWPKLERAITTHSHTVFSIAISQDGRYIISGSWDKTVRIWNVHSHTEECVFYDHTDWVRCVAICGDGSRAISGSTDGTLRVWDIANRKAIFTLEFDSRILAVAMTPDGERIASGHRNGLRVWDATNGLLVHAFREYTSLVRSVSFSPDGRWLISGSDDMTARVWNATTEKAECILCGHTESVWSVACSPNSDTIVTGSLDRTARLWDISGKELRVFHGHLGDIGCVAFMPNGRQVVTGSYDKTLRIWDVTSGYVVHIVTGLAERPGSIAAFPNGLKIASSSGETISIWSLRAGDTINGEEQNIEGSMPNVEGKSIVFSANGRRVLLLPSLHILDTVTLEEVADLGSDNNRSYRSALSASGSRVAVSVDVVIEVWELTGDFVANRFILRGHTNDVNFVSFSHDERQLVSTSDDGTVRIWDAATGERVRTLQHLYAIRSAAFSHDDTQIVSIAYLVVHVWNAQSGELLHQFDADIYSVMFSPDDHHVITSYESTINIYNAKSFVREHTHKGYKHWTTMKDGSSYALSDDGQWICHSLHLGDQPRRLLWIPSQYRPTLKTWDRSLRDFSSGPLFTSTPSGVQVCLPRKDGLVTLVIPRNA